jgi:formylglycine-generating enzyme required for sulfatase activity
LQALISSTSFNKPSTDSPYKNFDWKPFLSDKVLLGIGYEQGGKKEDEVDLCADGTFQSRITRTGIFKDQAKKYQGRKKGKWDVKSDGEKATLTFTFEKLDPVQIELVAKDEEIYVRGAAILSEKVKGARVQNRISRMKILKKPAFALIISVITFGCNPSKDGKNPGELTGGSNGSATTIDNPPGMVWIPGGEFTMGTDDPESYQYERPAHRVRVDGFWMDITEVTNADFKKFVDATGYLTIAEKKPTWEELKKQLPPGTPKPEETVFVPGSLVFSPPAYAISLEDYSRWWSWKSGTDWRHPDGPGSSLEGKDKYPVVHIAYEDAIAYCKWIGKRLPTEAEWEFASRGGREGQRFSWGERV